ncbi:MAG TPA: ATP-binding protein [Phenylobacterium sp.]|nr:ATP-binding protein [Phenylobacterium sp.]
MTAAAPSPPTRPAALRARLVMLVLTVLIPALLAAGLLLLNAYREERKSISRQMSGTARALALVVDRQIGQDRVLLEALATSPALKAHDWAAFDAQAREATRGGENWVAVASADGVQHVNTRLPRGEALPASANDGISWSGRPGESFRVSNLFKSRLSQSAILAVELRLPQPDGSNLELASLREASSFDRIWRDQNYPPAWVGSIIDARGVIVARNRDADVRVGMSASPGMIRRLQSAATGVAETVTLDGIESLSAWSRAPDYGWSVVVAAPRTEVSGEARQSLTWAGLLGLAFLMIGVGSAGLVARRLVRPVEALADNALAWAEGNPIPASPSGVREFDALAASLSQASLAVADHQRELKDLNATLEMRVAQRTQELAEASETLVQAQKMEAIGRLTGGVAHDFNNLLMAVLGNLDLLARRIDDPKLRKYVDQARAAGERGAKLTAQLLAFARRQRLEPRPIDVASALSAAADMLRSTLGGGHAVDCEAAPDLWPAIGDVTQVELMIVNLALNARDAMPAGGRISISAANVRLSSASARPESPPPGDYAVVTVADTGEGMPAEVMARVFEPFFTTKPPGKGSGLGLPQVLGLAKQMGGGVEIETAPGQGTIVRVYLPRSERDATVETAPAADLMALKRLRVLLVDDDPDVRIITVQILEEMGCKVTAADSGEAALELARRGVPFDAALVDFAMPGLNGGETARRLRDLEPGLPVVLMSGYADLQDLAEAWTGPVLRKPFSSHDLACEIARVTAPATVAP